jgi:hypothetical protein
MKVGLKDGLRGKNLSKLWTTNPNKSITLELLLWFK